MPRIEEILTTKDLIDYTKSRTLPAMVGETLFPSQKTDSLEIEMIKGANNLPVSASVHAFDTETEIGSREGASKGFQELALIKRKERVDEKTLIALNNPRTSAEEKRIINELFNSVDRLVSSVIVRVEAMRLEALSTGKLQVNENGVKATIDYGMAAAHKAGKTWASGTPDILQDIFDMCSTINTNTGFKPSRILTSTKNLNILLKDSSIRSAVFGVNSAMLLTPAQLNQFLAAQSLPQIAVYDAMYRVQAKSGAYTTKRYLDEKALVLMPDGKMGDTFYGPTAEEIELATKGDVDIEMIGNILVEQYATNDPVAKWIKAVATAMPSFPYADQVGVITVG